MKTAKRNEKWLPVPLTPEGSERGHTCPRRCIDVHINKADRTAILSAIATRTPCSTPFPTADATPPGLNSAVCFPALP